MAVRLSRRPKASRRCAPILLDITVDGRDIKAVVQITKQAYAFAFDRVTGEPIWPIEEREVPESDTPGEWTSPTQPFPTKPAPFEPQGFGEENLIDLKQDGVLNGALLTQNASFNTMNVTQTGQANVIVGHQKTDRHERDQQT